MPKVFFMSYATPRRRTGKSREELSQQKLVDEFFHKLEEHIGSRLIDNGQSTGFKDSLTIEAGTADWVRSLSRGLADFPIGLLLMTPSYFQSDRTWCRWEFEYLLERNHRMAELDIEEQRRPRLLLLLEWIPTLPGELPKEYPTKVQRVDLQLLRGREDRREAVQRVLLDGVQAAATRGDDLTVFIQALGDEIILQWERWEALAPSIKRQPEPRPYDPDMTWTPTRRLNSSAPPGPRRPSAVAYAVCLAATPKEVPESRGYRYREFGEAEWKPFAMDEATDASKVDDYLASLEGIRIEKWPFLHFKANMASLLREQGRRRPVLLILDPWTVLRLDTYRKVLENYCKVAKAWQPFVVPVVIWNEEDSEAEVLKNEFLLRMERLSAGAFTPLGNESDLNEYFRLTLSGLQIKIRNIVASGLPNRGGPPPRIGISS